MTAGALLQKLRVVWLAWFPVEETRLVVRHVITWMVILTGFWVTAQYALWLGVPPDQQGNIEFLEGFVMTGSLAVLGIRFIIYLWKVTGNQFNVFIVAA